MDWTFSTHRRVKKLAGKPEGKKPLRRSRAADRVQVVHGGNHDGHE